MPSIKTALRNWVVATLGIQSGVLVSPAELASLRKGSSTSLTGSGAFLRATLLLAQDAARADIEVYNSKGELLPNHPVHSLLRAPNSFQTGFDFRRTVTSIALQNGNGMALIRHDANGDAVALEPLPINAATPAYDSENGIVYRVGSQFVGPESIIHLGAVPDPIRPLWFQSPLDVLSESFALASDSLAVSRALVRTGTAGKIVISADTGSDQLSESIQSRWETIHQTPEGASRPLVVRGGSTATSLVSGNASDVVLNAAKFSGEEIGRAYGVPPELLFFGGSYSQPDAARSYLEGGLALWLEAWASQIQAKLCRPGETVRLNADWIADGALKDSSQALTKLSMTGIVTANEARRRIGMPRSSDPRADALTITMPGGNAGAVGMSDGNAVASEGDSANA